MIGLTPAQGRALTAIRALTRDGVPPSYREIAAELQMSNRGGVHRLLHQLKDRGAIEFEPHRARSIRVLGELEGLEKRSSADLQALATRIDSILLGRGL